ncbi:hypothetical protein ABZ946_24015 [Streptomyces sp. NPDC046324]|uniref:hypothetical protein n=1 Tax=Streptomyces sp. NPDC046324 TaxID=3154915 RepID=UPI0033C62469
MTGHEAVGQGRPGLSTSWLVTVPTCQTRHGRTLHGARSWIVEAFDHPGALGRAAEVAQALTDLLTGPPVARPPTT